MSFTTEAWEGYYRHDFSQAVRGRFRFTHDCQSNGVDCYIGKFPGGKAKIYHRLATQQDTRITILLAGLSDAVREEFEKLQGVLRVPLFFAHAKVQNEAEAFGKEVIHEQFLKVTSCHNEPLLASRP